jgi:hypothetical protein
MTDLVERLHRFPVTPELKQQVAEEITLLRRALEKIAALSRTDPYSAHLARVALETSRVREEG